MLNASSTGKDEVLLSGRGSGVVLDAVTLFVTCAAVLSVKSNTAFVICVSKPGRTPMVQVIVPVPPEGGVLQLKVGPLVCSQAKKVLPDGTVSVSVTAAASFGPLLRTVTVNSEPPPKVATDMSAAVVCDAMVVVRLAVLLAEMGSLSSPDNVAVLVSTVPAATPLLTRKVSRNAG